MPPVLAPKAITGEYGGGCLPAAVLAIEGATFGALRFSYLDTFDELMDEMTVTLGGRAAEQLEIGGITTGASDDLKRVASISRSAAGTPGPYGPCRCRS